MRLKELENSEDPVLRYKAKLDAEKDRFNARLVNVVNSIASFHRQERFRVLKEGARLATKRQKRYRSFIDEVKKIDLNKLSSQSAEKLIATLEIFIEEVCFIFYIFSYLKFCFSWTNQMANLNLNQTQNVTVFLKDFFLPMINFFISKKIRNSVFF